jgi:hypothetical protein
MQAHCSNPSAEGTDSAKPGQRFLVEIDSAGRFKSEPLPTDDAPLSLRFCGLSLASSSDAMGMAAAWFGESYRNLLRYRRDGKMAEITCPEGGNLLDWERKGVARAVMGVVAAACTSRGSHEERMLWARRNLLCRARSARSAVGLRSLGDAIKSPSGEILGFRVVKGGAL